MSEKNSVAVMRGTTLALVVTASIATVFAMLSMNTASSTTSAMSSLDVPRRLEDGVSDKFVDKQTRFAKFCFRIDICSSSRHLCHGDRCEFG